MEILLMEHDKYLKKIAPLKPQMPFYVLEYYRSKMTTPLSSATMYVYFLDFKRFFEWLIRKKLTNAKTIKEICFDDLEYLSKKDVEKFVESERKRLYLQPSTRNSSIQGHEKTIKRTMEALKSLFNYLTQESENELGDPYFQRNVMARIHLKKVEETLAYRAARISNKLLLGHKTNDFLEFIKNNYEKKLSARAKVSFKQNKERDLAMLALVLSSGLRCSELVGIDLVDINIEKQTVKVLRKEGKRDSVPFGKFALPYLNEYLEIREKRYKLGSETPALFITQYGDSKRISLGAFNKLVAKYSEAFEVRVTPHVLRHTLATRLYSLTNSQVTVSHQLGHSSTAPTDLYTHITQNEVQDALKKL